jgi:hypothetical protein
MQIIDKRRTTLTVTFGDLRVGEAFQDEDGDLNIKTDEGSSMYWDNNLKKWCSSTNMDEDYLIIPLEVTYTFDREDGRK